MTNLYSMTDALRERLSLEMERDSGIFLMGEDIGRYGGAFGVTRGLIDRFGPERVRDTPIIENTLVGVAVGAALAGSRPVVEIMFMDFITLALDQLANQAAKMRYVFGFDCPLVLRTPAGGGRGYGATHSQCLERLLFGIPGLMIATPSDPTDASALLATALRQSDPVVFIEHKQLYGKRSERPETAPAPLPFGRSRFLYRGTDLTIVCWSWMCDLAIAAARLLEQDGISAEVVDLRTLSPLDMDKVCQSAADTGRVMIVEEGTRTGGVSAEIGCRIFEQVHDCLETPICRVCSPDMPVPAARVLEQAILPNPAGIASAARQLLEN